MHTRGSLHGWYHIALFFALAFLAARISSIPFKRALFLVAVLAFGVAMEYAEDRFGDGYMEWGDVLYDSAGALCGWLAAWFASKRQRRHVTAGQQVN